MRGTCRSRVQKAAKLIRPELPQPAHKAVIQLLWIRDVLTSYERYLTDPWQRAIISSCINAVSPTNPKIKEFFR